MDDDAQHVSYLKNWAYLGIFCKTGRESSWMDGKIRESCLHKEPGYSHSMGYLACVDFIKINYFRSFIIEMNV